MPAKFIYPRKADFSIRSPQNLILVENLPDDVVLVRATENNFSAQRKAAFIRALAAEGFIPDEYQSFAETGPLAVRWIIDGSWMKVPAFLTEISNRRRMQFIAGVFLVGVIFVSWLSIVRS